MARSLPAARPAQRLLICSISGGGFFTATCHVLARGGRGACVVASGWDRETTWRFDNGAPPSVVWKFELPNGNAEIEVELASAAMISSQRTKIELKGEETSVELADAMRGLP